MLTCHKIQSDQLTSFHHFSHHVIKSQTHSHQTSSRAQWSFPSDDLLLLGAGLVVFKMPGHQEVSQEVGRGNSLLHRLQLLQPGSVTCSLTVLVLPEWMPVHSMASLMLFLFPYPISYSPACPLQPASAYPPQGSSPPS